MIRSLLCSLLVLAMVLALDGCWGRRRHRNARPRVVDTPEPTVEAYEPPPPPAPAPPPLPPPPPPAPAAEPLSSETSPGLVSRFRSTRSSRCDNPRDQRGQSFSVQDVDSSDVLNVRAQPDWRSAIVGTLPPDTQGILGLGERQRVGTASWRKVVCGKVRGWVNDKFLEPEATARTER